MNTRLSSWSLLALLVAMILWASSFIALKYAFQRFDPYWVIWGRMLVAALCILPFLPWLVRQVQYQSGDWLYLLGMSACEPCFYFLFEATALKNTTAAQAGMITALLPLLVAVGAAFVLREQIRRQAYVGFAVAMLGVVWLSLISGQGDEYAPHPAWGNFLELMAMVCAATYTLLLKYLTQRYSPWSLTALQVLVGSLFFMPLALWQATPLPTNLPLLPSMAVVYLGIAVTLGAYGLYNFAVSQVPASQASAFINLIPVLTLVMAWVLLGERLSLVQILACVVVLTGLFISQMPRLKWHQILIKV
ncbi:DMT family transporter [Balneatrix alpica]|uniref:DMT family transporter n=1 Tax=Balneatrix alpica TaxID=75684 RepID=A0ABV5Z8Y2_9GAMM|nr:DMT family transporter [Balneatrix alpica]